jgi:hypothetical protein
MSLSALLFLNSSYSSFLGFLAYEGDLLSSPATFLLLAVAVVCIYPGVFFFFTFLGLGAIDLD